MRKHNEGFTLIEALAVIVVIWLFVSFFIPSTAKKNVQEESTKTMPAQQETLSVTLEWKEGVKATPENIEIVYGVKETRIDKKEDAQFLVLIDGNGEERYITLNENLLSWKIGK